MIKQIIRLIRPYSFLPILKLESPQEGKVLVRPRVISICAADQRYFQGNRSNEVLAQKLPMALIHEALGEVISDPSGTLQKGDAVILLPGGEEHGNEHSNYGNNAFFRSSSSDGFCQEMIYMNHDELIPVEREGEIECYVFSELMSVCCHAVRRLASISPIPADARIGVWGDGPMGYMMALVIRELSPDCNLTVFGKHDEKLMLFSFVDKTVNVFHDSGLPEIDFAFECVGGDRASIAIAQIIQALRPCGTSVLMGVTEISPVVDTRKILEKGLLFLGVSRSQRQDFEIAKKLIDRSNVYGSLEKIISRRANCTNYMDLYDAFIQDRGCPYRSVISMNL